MGFVRYNCADCSHSLLSVFYSAFETILLMKCDLCSDGSFGTISDFRILEGICDANCIY